MANKIPLAGLVAALLLALALPAAAQGAKPKRQLYVSLGDSYAVGWQHPAEYTIGPTTKGFANQTVTLARKKGYRLKLVNFGCGGATTVSILKQKGCAPGARAIGGKRYSTSQAKAAERFLRRNRGKVALVTVSISGNDVTSCAKQADPVPCVTAAIASVKKNVTTLAKRLRKAGGKRVRIVGITYPDVILGQWVRSPVNQDLARLSVNAFRDLLNPALRKAYKAAKGTLVDVTAATGAYTPLGQTTTLGPYGTIPIAVAKVCQLTWYCQFGDIHANTAGYKAIAKLVVKALPRTQH
jgi:lysophospholipase L1-like esterase